MLNYFNKISDEIMNNTNSAVRPLIGIASSRSDMAAYMKFTYMDAVWRAGGMPVVLSYTTDPEKLAEYGKILDGFLFSGGVDVNPIKYGEEKKFDNVNVDDRRDAFEEALFGAVYPMGKPILGICRGIQSINVWMGGTLHQHIDGHGQSEPGHIRTHPVTIYEGSMFHKICGKTSVMVNSCHHQVVKDLAPALVADAINQDGYIEAVHLPDHKFLFAVQFHPENYCGMEDDDHSLAIFEAFVNSCKKPE